MPFYLIISVLLCCFTATAVNADTSFRCGNSIIDLHETMYLVRHTCGDPESEQRVGERTTYSYSMGGNYKIKEEIYIVEWVYPKDSGYYILTFEGSRLVKREYSK